MSENFMLPVGCSSRVVCQAVDQESREERTTRLYASEGGPLLGWLFEECARRGQTRRDMSSELGVTYSYIHQLRTGVRQTRHLSSEVACACARYLGVPPIVVKLLAGVVPMADFAWPEQTEPETIDRALDAMKQDAVARTLLPANVKALPIEAKRSLVLMYAENSRQDILGVKELPDVVQWLQRAATIHNHNMALATS
ncbi:helix-turn-helix transcriptional regulator [Pelomonas sp. KK5]|uniref:helix-turn-helix domain-containing protein n=1 Tax=Pelomonas sp. KK5 TaxID=1855730 RepID=UPI00117EE26A|nr:helix-turn-helix transcriptional regulator [Pelomonas sp. KK5]